MKGVLLVNLGTPCAPTHREVYRYLIQFLTDKRVIVKPWWLRQLLVRGVIVPARLRQSTRQYKAIWTKEGSPLKVHSLSLRDNLQKALGSDYTVALAMRYRFPSIQEIVEEWRDKGLEEIVVIPLFPQYCSATTGSIFEEIMRCLSSWEEFPRFRWIDRFFDHPAFVEAVAQKMRRYPLETYDQILMSFHGLPVAQQGNYPAECYGTAEAIAKCLGLKNYKVCFQSRLGKEPWVTPYTSEVIEECAKKGDRRLLVVTPSFVCDCLETIFEIGEEYKKEFLDAGGESLDLVEGLNGDPDWVKNLLFSHRSIVPSFCR